MSASELITLGIGTPSSIPYFLTVGLGIGVAAPVSEPYRVDVAGADLGVVAVAAADRGAWSVDGADRGAVRVDGEARI